MWNSVCRRERIPWRNWPALLWGAEGRDCFVPLLLPIGMVSQSKRGFCPTSQRIMLTDEVDVLWVRITCDPDDANGHFITVREATSQAGLDSADPCVTSTDSSLPVDGGYIGLWQPRVRSLLANALLRYCELARNAGITHLIGKLNECLHDVSSCYAVGRMDMGTRCP